MNEERTQRDLLGIILGNIPLTLGRWKKSGAINSNTRRIRAITTTLHSCEIDKKNVKYCVEQRISIRIKTLEHIHQEHCSMVAHGDIVSFNFFFNYS